MLIPLRSLRSVKTFLTAQSQPRGSHAKRNPVSRIPSKTTLYYRLLKGASPPGESLQPSSDSLVLKYSIGTEVGGYRSRPMYLNKSASNLSLGKFSLMVFGVQFATHSMVKDQLE